MAPLPRFSSRVPSLKLKIVFAPRRVMVRSVKVSSARDSTPVRTAVPCGTSSLTAAARGAARPESNFTSLMIWVTRALFSSAAFTHGHMAMEHTQTRIQEIVTDPVPVVQKSFLIFLGRHFVTAFPRRRRRASQSRAAVESNLASGLVSRPEGVSLSPDRRRQSAQARPVKPVSRRQKSPDSYQSTPSSISGVVAFGFRKLSMIRYEAVQN